MRRRHDDPLSSVANLHNAYVVSVSIGDLKCNPRTVGRPARWVARGMSPFRQSFGRTAVAPDEVHLAHAVAIRHKGDPRTIGRPDRTRVLRCVVRQAASVGAVSAHDIKLTVPVALR